MKGIISLVLCTALSIANCQNIKPKLVIGIVVDQMKQDYLNRYGDRFGEGGFSKLISDGFMCENTHYNYIPTVTAAGHASIYTGTTPRYHGIIGNSWYSKKQERMVYCVGDENESAIGGSEHSGHFSPRNLATTTITDELKLSTNFQSKVISISIKDRGSVLPAGHNPDGAFWYDGKTGNFVTSTYYSQSLPGWVAQFNAKELVNKYLDGEWAPLLDIESYSASTEDNVNYENTFRGIDEPTFPYHLAELRKKNGPYELIMNTPFGNSITLDMAKDAVMGESMGSDDITDFLAVSISSTDKIGHQFGPNSIEIEDTYLRLDRDLEKFIDFLDEKVGEDNYLIFLTSDHAAALNPTYLQDQKMPAGTFKSSDIKSTLQKALTESFGEGDWIKSFSNYQFFLNQDLIPSSGYEEVINTGKKALMEMESIAEVYTAKEVLDAPAYDHLGIKLNNGYNRQLSGDLMVVLKSGYLFGSEGRAGTDHGSGYVYDTHVPLLFYGKGIKNGSTTRKVAITDIAPTISMILNISLPSACTGEPIKELFD